MTGRQGAALAAVFLVALAGGALLAMNLLGGTGTPAASPLPTASAIAEGSPSASSGLPSPSEAVSSSASAEVTSSPPASPVASASAGASAQPPNTAVFTYTKLKLDGRDDPEGKDRVITFSSQGAGDITVLATALSPQGTFRMCLSTPTKALGCKSTSDGSLHASTTKPKEDFIVTLRGFRIETPTIEIKITFPAAAPSVTITNVRFDGTDTPDYNGIQAFVTPRADGNVGLQAEWGGHPFLYDVNLAEQGGPGSQTVTGGEAATGADLSLPVTGTNPWLLTLANAESGFGPTNLTATISWP